MFYYFCGAKYYIMNLKNIYTNLINRSIPAVNTNLAFCNHM